MVRSVSKLIANWMYKISPCFISDIFRQYCLYSTRIKVGGFLSYHPYTSDGSEWRFFLVLITTTNIPTVGSKDLEQAFTKWYLPRTYKSDPGYGHLGDLPPYKVSNHKLSASRITIFRLSFVVRKLQCVRGDLSCIGVSWWLINYS